MIRFMQVFILSSFIGLAGCSDSGPVAPTSSNGILATAVQPGDDSIAQIAGDNGFTELVGALQYVDAELGTGLVTLFAEGDRQLTVFAPTNQAFTDLYTLLSGVLGVTIDEISDIPAPVVLDVLSYHVTPGRRAAASVLPKNNEKRISTLLGESFFVRNDGSIRDGLTGLRNDATIVDPDISAANGMVHGINQVIVPPSVVAALTAD